jgi:hypothetical protein
MKIIEVEIEDALIDKVDKLNSKQKAYLAAYIISQAFTWHFVKPGYRYWNRVYLNLINFKGENK